MSRNTGSRCKQCRREGMKLFLKGTRCATEKCAVAKRPYAPGVHGKRQRKPSYYALQLREKQKVKRIYGMPEKPFRRFFSVASKSKEATGNALMQLLESRLDNVVYRSLFTLSRAQARQIVRHGHTFVNNRRKDIPSALVKPSDIIQIRGNDTIKKLVNEHIEINAKERSVPQWLSVDNQSLTIKVTAIPQRDEVAVAVNEQFIVELYSK